MFSKGKILNDPVYGFVELPRGILFDLIEHPFFQRLRRIKQLGLTHLVFPGALHTRFQHSIGAMHLMWQAINILRGKDVSISNEEMEAAMIAILLHDIGHGPFSHALEHSIVSGVSHEDLSLAYMQHLNKEFDGQLSMAIQIFLDEYPKKFLHQLVSGQLDMDRMDYMNRDSFFCGVSEGIISGDRILKMLNIQDGGLVVEVKGIYSIEKFIIARRLMYWQVYLHKTVIAAEYLLMQILSRAKYLSRNGVKIEASKAFQFFLEQEFFPDDFSKKADLLERYALLDDFDVMGAVKSWIDHSDPVLSRLSNALIHRRLFRVIMQAEPFNKEHIEQLRKNVAVEYKLSEEDAEYFVFHDKTSNYAYNPSQPQINIQYKDGQLIDVTAASDQLNLSVLSQPVTKHFLCFPKELKYVDK